MFFKEIQHQEIPADSEEENYNQTQVYENLPI